MRAYFDPLASTGESIAISSEPAIPPLWTSRLDWNCRGRRLDMQVLGAEPLALPQAEPSEPPEGALARVSLALAGSGAQLLLRNPAEAFGRGRMSFAQGARLFAITSSEDEACWDEALSLGWPIYGVRGRLACEVLRPRAASLLSALAYGLFVCEEGLEMRRLDEDRTQVAWDTGRPETVTCVVVRAGFEAGAITGATGSWRDTGRELYVRLVLRAGEDRCWTQPRFISPRAGG